VANGHSVICRYSLVSVVLVGCVGVIDQEPVSELGPSLGAGSDAGASDAAGFDAGSPDAGSSDAGGNFEADAGAAPEGLVSCVGDSITAGYLGTPGKSYPDVLRGLLGSRYHVQNFGKPGATLLHTQAGYTTTVEYGASTTAAAGGAGNVVIQLGTNDSKPGFWTPQNKALFVSQCEDLVAHYQTLASAPRVWVNLPPPANSNNLYSIDGSVLHEQIAPLLKQCAGDRHAGIIDVYSALLPYFPLDFPDGVHPNDAGAALIALAVQHALMGLR
jgi:lysophospholipase L1-like esterase